VLSPEKTCARTEYPNPLKILVAVLFEKIATALQFPPNGFASFGISAGLLYCEF
jgi:hypothetical protein